MLINMRNHRGYYYECHFIEKGVLNWRWNLKNKPYFFLIRLSEVKNAVLEWLKVDRWHNLIVKGNIWTLVETF